MIRCSEHIDADEVRAHAKGLKLHLREIVLGGYPYRVVTLRPSTRARFSTNFFHDTWHILTDREGAWVLSRLLWGLAFQRAEGTLVLIDGEHLLPTPFEADPASPILLLPRGLTRVDARSFRLLRKRLREVASRTTIRFLTFGLPAALADDEKRSAFRHREWQKQRSQERVQRIGGMVCYSAPPDILRMQALFIHRMRTHRGMGYHYLAEATAGGGRHPEGEVQIFRDFRGMVSTAKVARRQVIGKEATVRDVMEREAVYRQAELAIERLRAARR